nr:hypothetical protein [Desulfobacterales bacterium]
MACHNVGYNCLRFVIDQGEPVVGVFTHEDDPNECVWSESVYKLASRYGIPVFTPDDPNEPAFVQVIRRLEPSIIFSFYYRRMRGKSILDIPRKGCINLHGSLLAKYHGRCPVNWSSSMARKRPGLASTRWILCLITGTS